MSLRRAIWLTSGLWYPTPFQPRSSCAAAWKSSGQAAYWDLSLTEAMGVQCTCSALEWAVSAAAGAAQWRGAVRSVGHTTRMKTRLGGGAAPSASTVRAARAQSRGRPAMGRPLQLDGFMSLSTKLVHPRRARLTTRLQLRCRAWYNKQRGHKTDCWTGWGTEREARGIAQRYMCSAPKVAGVGRQCDLQRHSQAAARSIASMPGCVITNSS
jgi:hypothetical protein